MTSALNTSLICSPKPINKKMIGKFKDETSSCPIREFLGLRPKMYSFIFQKDGKEKKGKSPGPLLLLVRKIPFLSFANKRNYQFFAEIYRLNTHVVDNSSNPHLCTFVQRFLYGPKRVSYDFYRQLNLSSSLQPFRRLVFPHAHCSSKRKLGCFVRG